MAKVWLWIIWRLTVRGGKEGLTLGELELMNVLQGGNREYLSLGSPRPVGSVRKTSRSFQRNAES
jgi:hypothetical protein